MFEMFSKYMRRLNSARLANAACNLICSRPLLIVLQTFLAPSCGQKADGNFIYLGHPQVMAAAKLIPVRYQINGQVVLGHRTETTGLGALNAFGQNQVVGPKLATTILWLFGPLISVSPGGLTQFSHCRLTD